MEFRFKKVILTGSMVTAFSMTTAFSGMQVMAADDVADKLIADYQAKATLKENGVSNVTVDELFDGKFMNVEQDAEEASLEVSELAMVETADAQDTADVAATVDVGVESVISAGEEGEANGPQEEKPQETLEQDSVNESAEESTQDVQEIQDAQDDQTKEADMWSGIVMANVEETLNIREQADGSANVVGQLAKGAVGTIVEQGSEWTKISSGKVEGYVNNSYIVTGSEAEKLANELGLYQAEVKTDILRVRKDASEEAEILGNAEKGTHLIVIDDVSNADWMMVEYQGTQAFVAKAYVSAAYEFSYAKTMEEIQEEAKAAEELAAKLAEEQNTSDVEVTQTKDSAVEVAADDLTMIAAMIQCEAGGESFKGKVAVGNVILNRLKSGKYPNTIKGVLTQKYQFTPASTGAWNRVVKKGPNKSCIKAAKAALSGTNYVGSAKSFNNKRTGHKGNVIGNHVFW